MNRYQLIRGSRMIPVHTSIANDRRHYSAARHRSFLEHNLDGDFLLRTGSRFEAELVAYVNDRLPRGWRLYRWGAKWLLRHRWYEGKRMVAHDTVFRWTADWRAGRMTADARYRVDKHVKRG